MLPHYWEAKMWICQHTGCQKKDYDIGMHLKEDKVIFKSIISSHLNNLYIKIKILPTFWVISDNKDQIKSKNEFEGEGGNLNCLHKNPTKSAVWKISDHTTVKVQGRQTGETLCIGRAYSYNFNEEPVAAKCLK